MNSITPKQGTKALFTRRHYDALRYDIIPRTFAVSIGIFSSLPPSLASCLPFGVSFVRSFDR